MKDKRTKGQKWQGRVDAIKREKLKMKPIKEQDWKELEFRLQNAGCADETIPSIVNFISNLISEREKEAFESGRKI